MKDKVMHPLVELTIARIKESVREPEMLFWVFVFPILLAVALGIAFRESSADTFRIAVEESTGSKGVMKLLLPSEDIEPVMLTSEEAEEQLRKGKIDLIIGIDQIYNVRQEGDALTALVFTYDETRSNSMAARMTGQDAIERGLGRKDIVSIRDNRVETPGSRYIDFLIPGLIGMNLMGSGMWGVGFALVLARTRKLLKRLAATPMRRSHYFLGFMLSRMLFLIPEVAILVVLGRIIFNVRVSGSALDLVIVSILGSMTFAGLGMLVAARSRTIEGASGWMNFIMMPMYILSGCFFSYERFPEFSFPFIRALPLTALNDALRAVINDGRPLYAIWLELSVMSVWLILSVVVSLKIFRWQ
ncbi:MAG: ABC transporter permease [Deltaproteobacteria bacterium]|nr:ABC transporter permease [Deltaproteobacteria bacterium]